MKFSALLSVAAARYPIAELIFGVEDFNDRVEPVNNATGVPLAMFHGFGDACLNPGIHHIDNMLSEGIGAPVECFESGIPSLGEVLVNFEKVAQTSCKKLAESKNFQGEFDVIGLSQGGLLARWIVEKCDMPGKVRKMVTLGGPHMGVDAIPHCLSGPICEVVNGIARKLVYNSLVQDHLSPAGYFRDVQNFDEYVAKSVFLASLNNEAKDQDPKRKERFSALDSMFLVKWKEDTMIYPRETAWFQSLDSDAKNVLPLEQSEFYTNDRIGLKGLNEAGKVKFVEWPGNHLQITDTQIKTEVIPFLTG